MNFKSPELEDELAKADTMVSVVCQWFSSLSIAHFNIAPTITRVLEHICGDSGVHEAGRGADFRDEFNDTFTYTAEQARFLVSEMNRRFPRKDNKLTCIHHSFQGGPLHFHCQTGISGVTQTDYSVEVTNG